VLWRGGRHSGAGTKRKEWKERCPTGRRIKPLPRGYRVQAGPNGSGIICRPGRYRYPKAMGRPNILSPASQGCLSYLARAPRTPLAYRDVADEQGARAVKPRRLAPSKAGPGRLAPRFVRAAQAPPLPAWTRNPCKEEAQGDPYCNAESRCGRTSPTRVRASTKHLPGTCRNPILLRDTGNPALARPCDGWAFTAYRARFPWVGVLAGDPVWNV
jgi:hypothetical protein